MLHGFLLSSLVGGVSQAWAQSQVPASGKTLVRLDYPRSIEVPLPDGSFHELSHDLSDRLNGALTRSGEVIVLEDALPVAVVPHARTRSGGYEWASFPVESIRIGVRVRELSFQTGARGDRTLYGWDERMRDPFLDEVDSDVKPGTNEFSAAGGKLSFFDEHFAPNDNNWLWGSYSGLDLSEGLSLNVLLAYMKIVVRSFKARVLLELDITSRAGTATQALSVPTQASGFYFDLAGGYLGYSGGVLAARRDAMIRAVAAAVESTSGRILTEVRRSTRVAALDGLVKSGADGEQLALLATGPHAGIPAGVIYQDAESGFQVETTDIPSSSGTIARVVEPGAKPPVVGTVLVASPTKGAFRGLARAEQVDPELLASEVVNTRGIQLPSIDFKKYGVSELSEVMLFLKSLAQAALLPYRIYRWWMYDQTFHKTADFILSYKKAHASLGNWLEAARKSPWGRAIGLATVPQVPERAVRAPVVAVIDTGVDYNHPVLHDSIAIEDETWTDSFGRRNRIGWDYYSGDARPFDENDHGTELASLVVAVAPHARILPLKAFNAWGMTSSQALYSSVQHAIAAQADIILMGWSTEVDSRALSLALDAADAAGILMVAAAGDRGRKVDGGSVRAYPASGAETHELLIAVGALNETGALLGEGVKDPRKLHSNWGATSVQVSAPGEGILVARPRTRVGKGSGTSISAALVAGALARIASLDRGGDAGTPERRSAALEWKAQLLHDAGLVPALERYIEAGRALRIGQ
jgi:subtilisin family serine protease